MFLKIKRLYFGKLFACFIDDGMGLSDGEAEKFFRLRTFFLPHLFT
jgi:hypothetical protein